MLSDRRNIVVIADEAHRSQYGFRRSIMTGRYRLWLRQHLRDALPNASFIGFTGTPIETTDANTPAVFGDYIDVYDIQPRGRGRGDGAHLLRGPAGQDRTRRERTAEDRRRVRGSHRGRGTPSKEKLKSKWAALEEMVGAEKRIELVAEDMVSHFEKRARRARRQGDDRLHEPPHLRGPLQCHRQAPSRLARRRRRRATLKVVMTGSAADPADWQTHIRTKARREALAKRFKDPDDPLKLVIVRDMWLTGFDAPCLHTMYVDKPMRGHGLMQAIARVNRVFKDKPGGLVVDYLGLADQLKKALADYTEGRPRGDRRSPRSRRSP